MLEGFYNRSGLSHRLEHPWQKYQPPPQRDYCSPGISSFSFRTDINCFFSVPIPVSSGDIHMETTKKIISEAFAASKKDNP